MLTLNDGRSELWQWDTGRKLTVDADCTQVHFSNKFFGRSVDVDVFDGTAEIPDVLLQADKDLLVWAFVGTAENGYTKISKVFKVNKRNKPADYVFTPPEQTTLGELIERLDKIEESQDPDAIKNAVDDYLANNPIVIDETDPTVPAWAKQPDKPRYTADDVGAISQDDLQEATNEALAQAKASGEFDGKDGYTPVKGVDYFDGAPGDKGEKGDKGDPGKNGANGKDGTSATHSWNGTVLTIASASGTSSSDLKGAKGDKGDKGDSIKGDPGSDGVSPTVAVSKSGKVTTVSITDKNGTKTATINDGADGSPGSNGKNGTSVTVSKVTESTEDGGSNVVTFSDGKTVTIKNGSKGSKGDQGLQGVQGEKGDKGDKGDTGATGAAGKDGVVDVTAAAVGQTIIVTAVDEEGRPTAWEAVNYQPRTHYEIPKKVLAENVTPSGAYVSWISYDIIKEYPMVTVVFDGATYVCPVTIKTDITENGDESYFYIGNYNGLAPEYPFYFFGYIGHDDATISPYSGHTISVTANGVLQKIDNKFIDAEWMATTGKGRVAVLPKAEYICVDGIIDTFSYEEENAAIDRMEEFVSGETYVVTLDGVEYECVAYNMVGAGGGSSALVGIGNQALCKQIPGADNGLPFFAYCHPQAGYNEVYLQNTEGEYTVNLGIDTVGEVPIKIPEKFLPDMAGVTAGASDWNAAEGEAGFIKNRTHWVEGGKVEVPVDGAWAQPQEGMNAYMCTSPTALEAGKTYVVNWDGVEYTCVAHQINQGEYAEIHLGNTIMNNGEDNGIPFAGVFVDGMVMFFAVDFTPNHTFTITEVSEVVHKLDERFMPESVDGVVIRSSTADSTKKFKLTVDDNGTITATEV